MRTRDDEVSQFARTLRILDCSEGIAAGFACRVLADLGCSVTRLQPEAILKNRDVAANAPVDWQRRIANHLHSGKNITFTENEGIAAAARRIGGSFDVLVEDRGDSFLEDSGFLHSPQPKIVSVVPFSHRGPYATWKSDASVLQAMGGLSAEVGLRARAPLMLPGLQPHYVAGLYASIAAQALRFDGALARRCVISEFESVATLHQYTYLAFTRLGIVRKRGQFYFGAASTYQCQDGGLVVVAPARQTQWEALALMCDQGELVADPKYATGYDRRAAEDDIHSALAPWFARRSAEQAFAEACKNKVPAARLNTPSSLASDPQYMHRGFFKVVETESEPVTITTSPMLINGVRPSSIGDGLLLQPDVTNEKDAEND